VKKFFVFFWKMNFNMLYSISKYLNCGSRRFIQCLVFNLVRSLHFKQLTRRIYYLEACHCHQKVEKCTIILSSALALSDLHSQVLNSINNQRPNRIVGLSWTPLNTAFSPALSTARPNRKCWRRLLARRRSTFWYSSGMRAASSAPSTATSPKRTR